MGLCRIAFRASLVIWATAALVDIAAHPACAQERDRLLGELEITDRVLERARAVVEESANERAAQELRFAFSLQERAKQLAMTDASLADVRQSVDLTARARQLAQRAVNIATQQAHMEQRALVLLEQLDRALEQAAARVSDVPTERAERLLGLATRRLERARESFQEQRYREAITMVQEALKLLTNLNQPTPGRHLERMLENTHRLLERVENEAQDGEQITGILERASTLIAQAETNLQNGQPFVAEKLLSQARELLLNAMRLTETPLDTARVDLLLEETAAFVQDVAAQLRDAESAEATRLIDNATRHLDRARELRAAGNLRQVLEEARVARNLARRAAQVAGIQQME